MSDKEMADKLRYHQAERNKLILALESKGYTVSLEGNLKTQTTKVYKVERITL